MGPRREIVGRARGRALQGGRRRARVTALAPGTALAPAPATIPAYGGAPRTAPVGARPIRCPRPVLRSRWRLRSGRAPVAALRPRVPSRAGRLPMAATSNANANTRPHPRRLSRPRRASSGTLVQDPRAGATRGIRSAWRPPRPGSAGRGSRRVRDGRAPAARRRSALATAGLGRAVDQRVRGGRHFSVAGDGRGHRELFVRGRRRNDRVGRNRRQRRLGPVSNSDGSFPMAGGFDDRGLSALGSTMGGRSTPPCTPP